MVVTRVVGHNGAGNTWLDKEKVEFESVVWSK